MTNHGIFSVTLVDDELSLLETLRIALEREGYAVTTFSDPLAAWASLQERRPNLLILDVMMPRLDGLELCRRLRQIDASLPVMFLSSKNEEIDRILGLEIGGDDYLAKPFSLRELLVRIKIWRRRQDGSKSPVNSYRAGAFEIDVDCFSARLNDQELSLTVTEFRLLESLIKIPGHVKTRDQLMMAAYPEPTWVDPRTIDTHIKRIRRKIEQVNPEFSFIEAVHGLGYRWKVDS